MTAPGPINPNFNNSAVPSRRRFLGQLAAVGGAGWALAGCSNVLGSAAARPSGGAATTIAGAAPAAQGRLLPGRVDGRVLVVVELAGGNDGLSTLVPAGSSRYYDLRPTLAVPEAEVLGLDDEVGLHPALAGLHRRGVATVEGVGPHRGDLSHFAMGERWQRGDVDGKSAHRNGFLGRLTDALDDGSPLVGLSTAGPTAALSNEVAATMAVNSADDFWFLEPTDWIDALAYQRGWAGFSGAELGPAGDLVVAGHRRLADLAAQMADVNREPDWDSPMLRDGGQLGEQLQLAADLLATDAGVRVVYAQTGDFDTHQGHQWRQQDNLTSVDAAVDGFLGRMEEQGRADQVLVATISEFGRRVEEHDGGLDHGSASTMLLAGPVPNKRFGERPSLDDLDEDGNLQVSVGFDRYLATLAQEWLGVEAASVLDGDPEPLGIF